MALSLNDESRIWVIFDTCTLAHYYSDLHNLLALPDGFIIRYNYRAEWLSEEVVAGITEGGSLPRQVLLAYAQQEGYERGNQVAAGEEASVQHSITVPTRLAEMVNIVRVQDRYNFDLRVRGYPAFGAQRIFEELRARRECPFRKWVAFSQRVGDFAALPAGANDERWSNVVQALFRAPSQFAGDVFWRVISVRPSGKGEALTIGERVERVANEVRQVESYFPLVEDRVYALEIETLRSPDGRGGRQKEAIRLKARAKDEKGLQVVGGDELDVRQYTGLHIELAALHIDGLVPRATDLTLRTEPKDGNWPQGPELSLRTRIEKDWLKLGIGAVAGVLGLLVGGNGVVNIAGGGLAAIGQSAAGIVLVFVGSMLITGKPQLK